MMSVILATAKCFSASFVHACTTGGRAIKHANVKSKRPRKEILFLIINFPTFFCKSGVLNFIFTWNRSCMTSQLMVLTRQREQTVTREAFFNNVCSLDLLRTILLKGHLWRILQANGKYTVLFLLLAVQ